MFSKIKYNDFYVFAYKVKTRVEEDLKKVGAKINNLHIYKKWKHFPHVDGKEIRNGYYDKLEGLQSLNSTYYIGELLSFSITGDCIAYSKAVVKNIFNWSATGCFV